MNIQYSCPRCGEGLKLSSERCDCKRCSYTSRIDDDIVDLIVDPKFYYGEISQEKMDTLARDSKSLGWRTAFLKLLSSFPTSTAEYHRHHVVSETRGAWKFLLNKPREGGLVLDLGCGWGPTSVALARTFGHVVALDATRERLDFLKQRCHEDGLNNITYCRAGDGDHLPFADATFDAVVLNGVLEWIPVGKKGNPRDCQIAFLKEVTRILKPNGQLYLGIENRLGFKYFLGSPEDHTGVRFLSLVPRFVANAYLRIARGKPFRTYTYTRAGLRKLLTLGGFQNHGFYIPSMDYRQFSQIDKAEGPRPEPNVIVNSLKRKLWYRLRKSSIYPSVCLAHSVIASKQEAKESILDGLVGMAAANIGIDKSAYRLSRYIVSAESVVIAEVVANDGSAFMLKTPLSIAALDELQENHDLLRSLHEAVGPSLLAKIPTSICKVVFNDITAFVESRLPGQSTQTLLTDAAVIPRLLDEGKNFLCELHKKSHTSQIIDASFLSRFLRTHVAHLQAHYADQKLDNEFRAIADYLIEKIAPYNLPIVPLHGDFWLGNILVDQNRSLSGVIDWGRGILNGVPVVDLCNLVIEGQLYTYGIPVHKNFRDYLFAGDFTKFNFATDYIAQMGIRTVDLDAFAILSWMMASSRRLPSWKLHMNFNLIATQIDEVMTVVGKHVQIASNSSRRGNDVGNREPVPIALKA